MSACRMNGFLEIPMNRREALKKLSTASLALTALSFPRSSTASTNENNRPNIIFILSDDHRWDHLSAAGHPFIQTPNMDNLANEGVLFENAFVTTSLCSPSRASFLTGTYAQTHGVKNNLTPWQNGNITFLELLKKYGYDTAFIGKWHMPGKLPTLRGVDEFVTFTVQGGQGKYFNCPLIVNGREMPSQTDYITTELTDRGIAFIEKRRKTPFCLYLSHKAVHHQFLPPKDLSHLYDTVTLDLPKEMDPYISFADGNLLYGVLGPISFLYRNYCETIVALDREIGRLLNRVDELGLTENTIVIYASDNGYFWGEHNLVDKRYAYEEAIRIPYIMRYPKLIEAPGRVASQMILNVDLAPTLLDIAGIDAPSFMEGVSMAPILTWPAAPGRQAWLYEYFGDYPYRVPPHAAVRTATHKYIEFEGRRTPELYNIVSDPKEHQNIIGTPEGETLLPLLRERMVELKGRRSQSPNVKTKGGSKDV